MSDQERGMKYVEEAEIEPFIEEYEFITGQRLQIVAPSERPDFHCKLDNMTDVGVELVKLIQDPETRLWREILHRDQFMDTMDATIAVQELVYRKEEKRRSPGWRFPDQTILVVQLFEPPVESLATFLDTVVLDELSTTGFKEIWLADYTVLDPYNTVQLFGIKPICWRGLHDHSRAGTKPYG